MAAIIEATPPDRILRTDIYDRDPIERWHAGRVALLGDAAHPMTPNLGQGAGQAIEDAVVLDECLAASSSIEEALTRYEQRRVARANGIVRASRRFGAIAQWSNPMAAWVRDWAMSLTPASVAINQAKRLMDGRRGRSLDRPGCRGGLQARLRFGCQSATPSASSSNRYRVEPV